MSFIDLLILFDSSLMLVGSRTSIVSYNWDNNTSTEGFTNIA